MSCQKITLVFALSCCLAYSQAQHDLVNQAKKWVESCMPLCSPQQTHQLLSLVYWSYQRSQQTINVQRAWLADRSISEHIGYNIAHTRRNPALTEPIHPDTYASALAARQELIHHLQAYYATNTTYAELTHLLIKGNCLLPKPLMFFVKELRADARTIIAQTLMQSLTHLQEKFRQTQEHLHATSQHFNALLFLRSHHIKFLHYFWDYFPHVLVKSFISFDKNCTELQHGCSLAVSASYTFTQELWELIEKERRNFYMCYYRELYDYLSKHDYHPEQRTILIPEQQTLIESSLIFPAPEERA